MKFNLKNAAALAAAAAMSVNVCAAPDFEDLPDGWSRPALEYAVEKGIMTGSDGRLRPKDSLTRAEAAVIFNRMLANTDEGDISAFEDADPDAWYYSEMAKAVAAGIFHGTGSRLEPERSITREEIFTVTARALALEAGDTSVIDGFDDADSVSAWAAAGTAALVKQGFVSGSGNRLEPGAELTREEFAQLIYSIYNKQAEITETPAVEPAEEAADESVFYGTMKIPYSDFYANEGIDYEVDAVSSATTEKWNANQAGGLVEGTYNKPGENGGGTILGVEFPVRLTGETLDAAEAAGYEFTPFADGKTPAAYKTVSVENGGLVFSKTEGSKSSASADIELLTVSKRGDFQLKLNGYEPEGTLYGAILRTDDGRLYALRHLQNVWRNGRELAFSTGFTKDDGKGNALSYEHFAEIMGKTIDEIIYITDSGYVVFDTDIYIGYKHDGRLSVDNADISADSAAYSLTGLPADFDAEFSVEGLDITSENGALHFKDAVQNAYTLNVSDKNGRYVPLSADFELTVDDRPVVFSLGAIAPAEGYTQADADRFISQITTVKIDGEEYANSDTAVIGSDGSLNPDAEYSHKGTTTALFPEHRLYEVTVKAAGYSEVLSFVYTK